MRASPGRREALLSPDQCCHDQRALAHAHVHAHTHTHARAALPFSSPLQLPLPLPLLSLLVSHPIALLKLKLPQPLPRPFPCSPRNVEQLMLDFVLKKSKTNTAKLTVVPLAFISRLSLWDPYHLFFAVIARETMSTLLARSRDPLSARRIRQTKYV